MAVRETIDKRRSVSIGVTIGCLVLAVFLMVDYFRSGIAGVATRSYYSDDDGKSYFADSLGKLCPFDHGGKQAYLASVFQCSAGRPFVAYLSRIDPAQRDRLEKSRLSDVNTSKEDYNRMLVGSSQAKKPGTVAWVSVGTQAYLNVVSITCPNGGTDPHSVDP